MANLIIDIGNTALKAAWCDGITLGKTFRYQGERIMEYILSLIEKSRPDTMVLSSVRHLSEKNISRLEDLCGRLIIMDSYILENHGLPSYITPDRAASVIASRYLFRDRGCMIFDMGTTMTVDFLDGDGRYEGGNVSPGCRTRFSSIYRYSKQFPLIDSPEEPVEKGYDIRSSIEAGVINGIKFEIEGYMSHHPEKTVVFTGGDAIYFAKQMKNSIFVVCNLVLMGLALIAVEHDQKD